MWHHVAMAKGPTPREIARAENIERIKRLALSQLAESGAAELSLRAIAREVNIVSSAIYRYYASRDDLITDLIIDAYADLADGLEVAGRADRRGARRRWLETCGELRRWARHEPHRFALIYGSAIPGYRAPQDTIFAAGRVMSAFCAPVVGAAGGAGAGEGDREPGRGSRAAVGRALVAQLDTTRAALEVDVPPEVMLGLVGAFARVIGALTLELNGHFVGGFEPADALFGVLIEREADALGL